MTVSHVTGLTIGPEYHTGTVGGGKCSISFDEHLGANTQTILNTFAAAGQRGTFYVVGREMAEHPVLCQEMLSLGHEVGNHSWSHPHLPQLRDHGAIQLAITTRRMQSLLGWTPGTFRPPFGDLDDKVIAHATALGMATVKWSMAGNIFTVDPADVASSILSRVAVNSIVCLHMIDSHTQALEAILDGLTTAGLRSVPVCELLGGSIV